MKQLERKIGPALIACLMLVLTGVRAQPDLSYYFPGEPHFDPGIPTPAEIIGFEVGEKHVRHDQLVKYLYLLADHSDRIKIERYGWTYEHRPLLLLTISDPDHLKNIEQIRTRHLQYADPNEDHGLDPEDLPSVIWMGYSVHGNEPSGLNASMLVAYYLAAATSQEIKDILKETVILIDPSINPDGYSRFAQWVNQYKSEIRITDPNSMEHNEAWPRGRTNHYWFDLNRDWLPLQHMESQARIRQFHRWRPNILTDHHEMGSNSTFFFQPGIPSRNNPNTPSRAFELTAKIADYHAQALDEIGSLYYSRESFDDFYYGKGSTYPDVNGGIGILFEQASSRGMARETENGLLEFPFTIRNQVTVSLSTISAGYALKKELLEYQADFYREALRMAGRDRGEAYIIDDGNDRTKRKYFLDILEQHQIEAHALNEAVSVEGHQYRPGSAFLVPLKQPQYRLIRTLFEKSTHFNDSLFYDVSAWTFPLAFDMNYALLDGKTYSNRLLGEKLKVQAMDSGRVTHKSSYAYLMRWDDYNAPKALNLLFRHDMKVRVSSQSFTTRDGDTFEPGTIIIPLQAQPLPSEEVYSLLQQIAGKTGMDFHGVSTGYSAGGIDLGSPNIHAIAKPSIMLLVGDGISSYEAGEVWHLLDYRYGISVALVDIDRLNQVDINRYNTLVMVSGNYRGISDDAVEKLTAWLKNGNQVIGIKGGAKWLLDQKLANIKLKSGSTDTFSVKSYGEMQNYIGAQSIGGTIFSAQLDLSHPLCFGYPDDRLSLFRNGRLFFEQSANPYNNPVLYTDDPLESGYVSAGNYELIKNASALIVTSVGSGRTISFSDNPNFRAYWLGTNRLFLNAIYFGGIISSRSSR